MTTVAVAAYNIRAEDAETITDWINITGGGGISTEPDIVYQGTFAASRKIGTSYIGRGWVDATDTWDMTHPTASIWLAKFNVTNPAALLSRTAPALTLHIGSSATDYQIYYVHGNETYPAVGGWQLFALNPNIGGYTSSADVGTPVITAINYVGIMSDFSAGSKAENVVIDAIDFGIGLNLIYGNGASTPGVFTDFTDYDEGVLTNRFGYVSLKAGVIYVNGILTIGEETGSGNPARATVFSDDGAVVVWNNGYFASNQAGLKVNLASASNAVDFSNCSFIGVGKINNDFGYSELTSSEDTRPDITVTGSLGYLSSSNTNYQNFASASFNAATRVVGGALSFAYIIQSGSHISDVTLTTTSPSSFATIQDATFGTSNGLHDLEFIQGNDGHALRIPPAGAAQEYFLNGIFFTGYGSSGSNSASIFIAEATSPVTLSISDGDIPTVRSAGAPVLIQSPVIFTVNGAKSGSEIRIISGGNELGGQESNDGVTPFQYSYNYPGYTQVVDVVVHSLDYEYVLITDVSLGNSNSSLLVQQTIDRNYLNPA